VFKCIVQFQGRKTKQNPSESIALCFGLAEEKMSGSKCFGFKIFFQNSIMFLDPSEVSVNGVLWFSFFSFYCDLL